MLGGPFGMQNLWALPSGVPVLAMVHGLSHGSQRPQTAEFNVHNAHEATVQICKSPAQAADNRHQTTAPTLPPPETTQRKSQTLGPNLAYIDHAPDRSLQTPGLGEQPALPLQRQPTSDHRPQHHIMIPKHCAGTVLAGCVCVCVTSQVLGVTTVCSATQN